MARQEGRKPQVYHGLFATHPDNDDRLQEVIREANQHRSDSEVLVRREEYLRHIDGMAIGPAEFEGLLRGRYFYHRSYNFTLAFPEGWETRNFPDRLIAQAPGRDMQIRLTLIERNARQPSCDFLSQRFENLAQLRVRATEGFSGCQARVPGGRVWDSPEAFRRYAGAYGLRPMAEYDILVLEHSSEIFLVVAAVSRIARKHFGSTLRPIQLGDANAYKRHSRA